MQCGERRVQWLKDLDSYDCLVHWEYEVFFFTYPMCSFDILMTCIEMGTMLITIQALQHFNAKVLLLSSLPAMTLMEMAFHHASKPHHPILQSS